MKRTLFILLIFASFLGVAQNKKIDSLKQELKNSKQDTTSYNILIQIGRLYEKIDPDSSIYFNVQSLKLAEQLNAEYKMVIALSALAGNYYVLGNYEKALSYFNHADEIITKLLLKKDEEINKRLKITQAQIFTNLGGLYTSKSNYPKSLEYYLRSLKIAQDLGDKYIESVTLGNIGIIYYVQSNYPKSLEYYLKALKIAEELKMKKLQGSQIRNIVGVYEVQGDKIKALDFSFKSLKIAEEMGDKDEQAMNIINIGKIYTDQKNYKKGLEYSFKGLKLGEELKNKSHQAVSLSKIGIIYAANKDYSKALEYYLKSLRLAKELGDERKQVLSLCDISLVCLDLKEYKEAEENMVQQYALAKKLNMLDQIETVHENFSELYEKTDRPALALEHYKLFIQYRDSINNEENTKKTVRLEMNFDFEKKESAAKLEQEKKDAITKEESQKQKIIIYSVCAILILVIVFAIYSYRSFRQKQKANLEITLQKQIIEEKQKEVLDSIHYAKRIQTALITSEKYIEKNLRRLAQNN